MLNDPFPPTLSCLDLLNIGCRNPCSIAYLYPVTFGCPTDVGSYCRVPDPTHFSRCCCNYWCRHFQNWECLFLCWHHCRWLFQIEFILWCSSWWELYGLLSVSKRESVFFTSYCIDTSSWNRTTVAERPNWTEKYMRDELKNICGMKLIHRDNEEKVKKIYGVLWLLWPRDKEKGSRLTLLHAEFLWQYCSV